MSYSSLGGSFVPGADYTITGNWTFTNTPTIGSGAYVTTGATQTLTNKSLTAPTITGVVAGVPDLTLALGTNYTQVCTTQLDKTNSTLANIVGLTGFAVVAGGVYTFVANLSGTSTANGGLKVAFKYTTATMTALDATGIGLAADATGVVTHTTTATDQASLFTGLAAIISVRIYGRITVNAAGTIALQAAQNTTHADTSSIYIGSSLTFTRVS